MTVEKFADTVYAAAGVLGSGADAFDRNGVAAEGNAINWGGNTDLGRCGDRCWGGHWCWSDNCASRRGLDWNRGDYWWFDDGFDDVGVI